MEEVLNKLALVDIDQLLTADAGLGDWTFEYHCDGKLVVTLPCPFHAEV